MEIDDLIDAARAGDPQAHEELGRWLTFELVAFFSGHFKDADDVNDMVQQTIVDLLQKLDKYEHRGPGMFRRWVLRFAAYEAKTTTREVHRKRAREQKLRAQPVDPVLSPDSIIYGQEYEELLEQCMAKLPAHEREAIEHWEQGGTDAELARRVGVSVNTISSRRHRGRKRLGELLAAALATPAQPPKPSQASPRSSSSSSCN